MRILIAGSSGFIGSALISFFKEKGYDIHCLVRHRHKVDQTHHFWNPRKGILDVDLIDTFQIVINLAGENISLRRWSDTQKSKILESRLKSTKLLVDRIKAVKDRPSLYMSASAVGYYGSRGNEVLTESSSKGKGFLADLVWEWEKCASILKDFGVRVVSLRLGIVLGDNGGILAKILLPFRMGFGAVIGDGKQYMPWISIDDVNSIIEFIIQNEKISGAVNIVAPQAITNDKFSRALGKSLSRPVMFRVPRFILKMFLGEMAEEMLLSSCKAEPKVLADQGYKFIHENIDQAFATILEQKKS
jgi:uncharacterized protein (TIGR01777 family)